MPGPYCRKKLSTAQKGAHQSKPTAFPHGESRLPFEIPRDEPYREKIARLGQMITDRIPAKKGILTKDDPEYWGLASIVTDEMADVALK